MMPYRAGSVLRMNVLVDEAFGLVYCGGNFLC